MTIRSKRVIATTVALAGLLLVAACGSSNDDTSETSAPAAEDTTGAETTPAAETTAASETTVATETTELAPDTVAVADSTEAAAPAPVEVELVEFAVNAPATFSAGTVTLNVTNGGDFPHELLVVAGDSYESLPLTESGAVDEGALPAGALIGETARLDSGTSETLTLELAAGNYVLLCNITGGGSSHAARGQVLSVTAA